MKLDALNASDRAAFTDALGHVFEHSPWIATDAWSRRPFRNGAELHGALCATMHEAPRERQMQLIQAHPDLAGRLERVNTLTADSAREQAAAGLNRLTADELACFEKLNEAYRARFGFPFIICARLNAKAAILEAMQKRVAHSWEEEFQTALAEIEKIARLRLGELLQD